MSAVEPASAAEGSAGSGPAAVASPAPQRLSGGFVSGMLWVGGSKWLTQLISWPITIVTARLLAPSDYAYLALVTIFTRLATLLTEAGIGTAIVSGPELPTRTLRQFQSVAALLSLAAVVVLAAIAVPVQRLYGIEGLALVLLALAGTLVLDSLALVPTARMRRDFRFRELSLIDVARNLVDQLTTVTLAWLGARYWSLVFGYSAGLVVAVALVQWREWIGFARPRLADLRSFVGVSAHLTARNAAEFVAYNADTVIGGKLLASAALGAYRFANTLAFAPAEKLTALVLRVTPSLFGRVRDDVEATRRYLLRLTEALAMLVMPTFTGLAIVATDLVLALPGPQWLPAVRPMQWFCALAAGLELTAVMPHVLTAQGDVRSQTRAGIARLVTLPLAMFAGAKLGGATGMAIGWVVVGPVHGAYLALRVCRILALPVRTLLVAYLPAFAGTALMVAALLPLRATALATGQRPAIRLALSVVVGGAVYGGYLLVAHRRRILETLALLRRAD